MSLPSNKVCDEVSTQLFEGEGCVRVKLAEPYLCQPFQCGKESPAHNFVWNSLQVHEGFERLQMVEVRINLLNLSYASNSSIRNFTRKGKEFTCAVNRESIQWINSTKLVDTHPLIAFIIISIFSFIICIAQAMCSASTSLSEGQVVSFVPSLLLGMLLSSWSSLSYLFPFGR